MITQLNLTGKMAYLPCLIQQTWFAILPPLSLAWTVFPPALEEEERRGEERRGEERRGEERRGEERRGEERRGERRREEERRGEERGGEERRRGRREKRTFSQNLRR